MNKTNQKDIEGKKIDAGEYEEIEDANFIKFEKIGDKVEGQLIEKDESTRYGFGLYDIMTSDKVHKRFHGSSQLDGLMIGVNVYDEIIVEFIDTQKMPQGEMKLFRVQRKKA